MGGEYTVRKTNKEESVQNAFRLKFINFSAHFRTHSARLKRDEGLVGRGGARGVLGDARGCLPALCAT